MKSNFNNYIKCFTNSKIDKQKLIVEILSKFNLNELITFKKRTPSIFQSLLRIPSLKRKQFSDILSKGKPLKRNTVDIYGALTFIILNNATSINQYLRLKKELDLATAIQKYDDAYNLLTQLDTNVSVSILGTYYRLKLTCLDKGITACTQLYNRIYKENPILSFTSYIALKSASVELLFENEIEKLYRLLEGEGERNDIYNLFIAFAFPYKNFQNDGWLKFLPCTSIIDLYEGFLLQISKLPRERFKDKSLKNIIDELAIKIHDERLLKYHALLNPSSPNSSIYSEENLLIEKYYSGDYEHIFNYGQDYLRRNPFEATIIDIFYKSCRKINKYPNNLFPEESLAEQVHTCYQMSLANTDSSEIYRTQLRNICIAWYTIPHLRHIFQLFFDIDNLKQESVYINFWRYSLIPEIRDALFYQTREDAIKYLENTGYNHQNSVSISILRSQYNDTYNQSSTLLYGFKDEDIPNLLNDINCGNIAPILTGTILSQLFERLMKTGHYPDAICAFVNFRLSNPHIPIYINKTSLFKILTDAEDKKIPNQLELSIFYTMINADIYKRYLAYKRYIKKKEIQKASEIHGPLDALHQYFIGKVVDRNVLTYHVANFETDEEIITERIELCQKMLSETNEKIYADEITLMIKEQEVSTLAQQVNDSKIHVDIQPLINSELSPERLMFDTFSEVDDNLKTYDIKDLKGILNIVRSQYEGQTVFLKYESPTVKYKHLLFHQIALNIRDKFLFDPKYGLDKYLSARIRHGTLITQLRNHFLQHSLVTNKKDGGEYLRTNPWTQRDDVILPNDNKEKINNRLLKFTEWLDEQLREIKEEKIQIRTESNNTKRIGMFNYSEELMEEMLDGLIRNKFESFDAFVHSVINLLWKQTNDVLQNIRDFFKQYQGDVMRELSKLQNDIVPLMSTTPKIANDFKDTITACKTEFQTDISIVSNWFKPEQSNVRFFTIQQAVDTSLAVINKINQGALTFSNVSILDTEHYNGEYFNSFHDIFHDLMNNVLGYETKRPSIKGQGKIEIKNTNSTLQITMSNPICKNDIEELQKIILDQKNIPSRIAGGKTRKEGNSGCMKIYSTVMYSLGTGNTYENTLEDGQFVSEIQINTSNLKYHEDIIS